MKTINNSLLATAIFLLSLSANAQTSIVNVIMSNSAASSASSYSAKGARGSANATNNYNYTFGTATQANDNQKQLINITLGTDTFSYMQNANSYVKIRRSNNPIVSNTRCLLWVERAAATDGHVAVINAYNDNMENVFDGNTLNQGTDNLFANQGDGNGNNNNIERLDVIFPGGVFSGITGKAGFALFERGDDNTHDPFVMAAITAINANGTPTAFGTPVRVGSSHYGNLPNSATNYYVIRKDPGLESNLRMSTWGTQNIGGVFLSFSDLGIQAGVKIYGYTIVAYDLPADAVGADLIDYNNDTFFPKNTSSATTEGGIDLIALTGVLSTKDAIILPPTAYNITVSTMMNTASATHIAPLNAIASSGTIATYTILSIPAPEEGILSICDENGCMAVTPGQVLTPDQINQLSFQPNPVFKGEALFTYSATDSYLQISNNAYYTIPVIGLSQGPLPVKMISFTANLDKKAVQLSWQTAQELNSSHFEIQRSNDGNNFEPFATVTAKGTSAAINDYTTTDDVFFYLGTTIYYRIKMVDIDGKFKYSTVIIVKLNSPIAAAKLKVWPLPFANQLNADYYSEVNENVKISTISMDGKTVMNAITLVKKGQNILTLFQAQAIPSGTYLLTIMASSKLESIKIVKQ